MLVISKIMPTMLATDVSLWTIKTNGSAQIVLSSFNWLLHLSISLLCDILEQLTALLEYLIILQSTDFASLSKRQRWYT